MNWTRIALYATLGVLCNSLELSWDTVGFWMITALFLAADTIAHRMGFERGVATGIEMYVDMTEQQRQDLIQLIEQARKEDLND